MKASLLEYVSNQTWTCHLTECFPGLCLCSENDSTRDELNKNYIKDVHLENRFRVWLKVCIIIQITINNVIILPGAHLMC